jgi:hypothetical protein
MSPELRVVTGEWCAAWGSPNPTIHVEEPLWLDTGETFVVLGERSFGGRIPYVRILSPRAGIRWIVEEVVARESRRVG